MSKKAAMVIVITLFVSILMVSPTSGRGAQPYKVNFTWPIDWIREIPCAGEHIHLTGEIHEVIHRVVDEHGGYHYSAHLNPQKVKGVGLSSGNTYQGTGVTRWNDNSNDLQYEHTYVNNFRLIGQGPGNNLLAHSITHITTNANGEITADFEITSVECK